MNVTEKSDKKEHAGSSRKRKTMVTDQILEKITKRQEERHNILKKLEDSFRVKKEKHPIRTFFESIAETVMLFPPTLAVKAKKEVLEVVSRLELDMLQMESRPSTSASAPSISSFDTSSNYEYLQSPEASIQSHTDVAQFSSNIQESDSYTDCADLFTHYQL